MEVEPSKPSDEKFALELEGKSSVIHLLSCTKFKEKTSEAQQTQKWIFPFNTFEDAFNHGSSLQGRSYPKTCGKCKPWTLRKKIEASKSFTVKNDDVERTYNCIKSWLVGIGAEIQEETMPNHIKAKTVSRKEYFAEIWRELSEVNIQQINNDIEVKLIIWNEPPSETYFPTAQGALLLRLNQMTEELKTFIKESTMELDREKVFTYRDAWRNLQNPRPLLAKVVDSHIDQNITIAQYRDVLAFSAILLALYIAFFYGFNVTPFTENIIELALTYGAAALFVYWTYLSDKNEKEPVIYILLMLCWGVFSSLIAAPINTYIGGYFGELSSFTAAFIEEPVKALGLYVFLTHPRFRDEFNSPLDGIIYGFAVGMGFYAAENFLYYLYYDVGTLLIRILLCWGHGLWVAIVGLWIAMNRHNRGYNVPRDMLPGLSVAVFLHLLWNTWSFIPLLGGRMVFYQAIYQFGFLKKIINEGKRDELMRGGDEYVFSPLDREAADKRSHALLILALIIILGAGSMIVRGTEGYKMFSDKWVGYDFMGFSFEYPERLWVETCGASEDEAATEEYGEIWFGNYKGRTRELLLVKYGSVSSLHYWDTLNASNLIGDSIQLGVEASFDVYGHAGVYRNFTMVKGEDFFNCVVSGWLCDSDNRVFYVQYYTQETDSYETWRRVIESFRCHKK